jgi:hypothetical protein
MVDAFSSQFQNFLSEIGNITSKGAYDVQPKLKPVQPKPINMQMPNLPANNRGVASTGGGGTELDKLIRAIRSQESNDNYRAINRDSGALGGYQIMPFNLFGGSEWDRKALGRDVGRDEFLNNPQIQDAIARWQLGNYLKKYGAAGAAVAWYGGPGAVQNMYSKTTQTGGYPSLYAYWQSVLSKM